MNAWRAHFLAGIDLPLVGTTEAQLRSLRVPVCIVPGNDLTHPRARGALLAAYGGAVWALVLGPGERAIVRDLVRHPRHVGALAGLLRGGR